MATPLERDLEHFSELLQQTVATADGYLRSVDSRPPAIARQARSPLPLPSAGRGAQETLQLFLSRFGSQMPASTGPRFWGFVTGGTTPAALVGDWLASAYDLNAISIDHSDASTIEFEAIHLLRELFGLPDSCQGTFVTGATMANFAGLAMARAWIARQHGLSMAEDGLDLQAIAKLKTRYRFWLHVDAAFGGFAACSPQFRHLLAGLEGADSVTIDAHKWLNVPYDSAMIFTKRRDLQLDVFQNSAAYLGALGDPPDFVHLAPENSRRLRALPVWFTLMAYGRDGYREIVERNCASARSLGDRIEASARFRLLAPVRMNVVCFTLQGDAPADRIEQYLTRLQNDGRVFLTPTQFRGVPAIRAAFSNWRTQAKDIEIAWQAMNECLAAS